MKLHGEILAFALALAPALSFAAQKQAEDAKMTDERLVTILHDTNKEEIQAGRLAQQQGSSADIKSYGEKLVTDHTKADEQVMAAASKAGVKPNPSSLTAHDKERLLSRAIALVNPIRWPEPFGLVMVEALALGTPVLAFPEGAAPEIVESGRTGGRRLHPLRIPAYGRPIRGP